MKGWMKLAIGVLAILLVVVLGLASFVRRGFSTRDEPTAIETFVAKRLRGLSVPDSDRDAKNPVPLTAEVLAEGRAHFADHCAICHGNDGRGKTDIGQNLYPKVPDMWALETQSLTDGELFYIIENGVRLTGMPAWGAGSPGEAHDSWHLVHFIRHLPQVSAEELAEMRELNPKPRAEWLEEEANRKFLEGQPVEPPHTGHTHKH